LNGLSLKWKKEHMLLRGYNSNTQLYPR